MNKIFKVISTSVLVSILVYICIAYNSDEKRIIIKTSIMASEDSVKINNFEGKISIKLSGNINKAFNIGCVSIAGKKYLEIRSLSNALKAQLYWIQKTKIAVMRTGKEIYIVKVNSSRVNANKKGVEMGYSAKLINSKTYVPETFLSKVMNLNYKWLTDKDAENDGLIKKNFSYNGIMIGDSEEKVKSIFGEPARKDLSIYGFDWYIYNSNYSQYVQVGIKDGQVVGLYSNANNWRLESNVYLGQSRNVIKTILKDPLKSITKSNVRYIFEDGNWDMYKIDDYYTVMFYDKYDNEKLNSVMLVKMDMEDSLKTYYSNINDELVADIERQVFDLTNAFRAKCKKGPVLWDDRAANTSRKHSRDMGINDFFDHINLKGETPFNRMNNDGIFYNNAAENIASGQRDSIYAVEAWINSLGHRTTLLGNYSKLGVGVYQGGKFKMYYTQNFYTQIN